MCRKLLITLGILFLLSSTRAKADDVAYAYCPLGEGYVFLYDSPTGFQVLANLKCGQRVTVLDARDKDRTRVRTADGKEGYVLKSSVTAGAPGSQRQPAAPPSSGIQQPQSQPQPQPKPEPQALPQPQSQPQIKPQPEPEVRPEPKAQPQPEPKAQPELQAQAQPQPEPQPEPQSQVQTQSQPQVQLQAEISRVEPEPQPVTQPQPEPQPEPELHSQSQPQPQPAATAFTPFSTLGYGQNVPRMEVFGGFSYLNAGTSALTARQNVVGFEGSVSINLNSWVGGEANFSGYYKTITIVNVATVAFRDYSAMAGPRINMHKAFFHALVGIDHLVGSTNFYGATASSDNALAGAAGGGVQWNMTRQLALRTSADYVMSRFGGVMQNNFRVTLGIVFEAGSVNRRSE
jgi:hypothetical protein